MVVCAIGETGTVLGFDLIKGFALGAAIFTSTVPSAGAALPGALTTLEAIHHLNNEQASQRLSVSFQATVSYYRGFDNDLFVQDRDAAIDVDAKSGLKLVPGDHWCRERHAPAFDRI